MDICPRRRSFLLRQTVHTFTLEHVISYTPGLEFLFVFFILPTARFRGMFRGYSGVFRGCSREYSGPVPECSEDVPGSIPDLFWSVPRCPFIPHNGNPCRKGTLFSRSRCRKVRLYNKAVSGDFFSHYNICPCFDHRRHKA